MRGYLDGEPIGLTLIDGYYSETLRLENLVVKVMWRNMKGGTWGTAAVTLHKNGVTPCTQLWIYYIVLSISFQMF